MDYIGFPLPSMEVSHDSLDLSPELFHNHFGTFFNCLKGKNVECCGTMLSLLKPT